MQGLFGRFGKKQPEQPPVTPKNFQPKEVRSRSRIDEVEFPSARVFDIDDEETNWDDAETLADENNPIVYAQPIVPAVTPPPIVNTIPDLDDWDEALPAATVKNSNIQEARRIKKTPPAPVSPNEDIWEDDVPSQTFSPSSTSSDLDRSTPDPVEKTVGIWASMLGQLRRILPPPLRQLSDAILTAILVVLVTIGIWVVDGFFVPSIAPSTAAKPPTTTVVETPAAPTVDPTTPTIPPAPQISPEQAFIEAIQTQLTDITSQYPDNIISGLDVNTASNLAIVRLNPIWYTLDEESQNRLTEQMWLQAKTNHFRKLEVRDAQNISIARSPVVGSQMIILQRRQG